MRLTSIILVASVLPSLPALAQNGAAIPAGLLASCESCHGIDGRTRSAEIPRLNGQTREYLAARLLDLRNGTNQTVSAIHNMLGTAQNLTIDARNALAAHFAAEPATQPNHTGPDRDSGALLYARGRADIPACAGCHGDKGQGVGEAARLAGQHGAYLTDQMNALMFTARVQGTMNKHAWSLSQDDIRQLTAFLAND